MNARHTAMDHPPDLSSLSVAITQQAPLPMATVEGSAHQVRYANPAFCLLMGAALKDLLGKPLSTLLPNKDRCVTLLDRVHRSGTPVSHTERSQSKPHPVFWSYTMWPVQEGQLVGIMIQVTETAKRHSDIVAMNEALILGSLRQHRLTEDAERFAEQLQREVIIREKIAKELSEKARLLDLSHDAIIVRDMEGQILYWNHGAEELYGWSSDEARGQVFNVLLKTEYAIPVEQMTDALLQFDRWTGELIHTRRNGQRITVLARKTLDRDINGNPVAVLENITDITARKQGEEAVRAAGERFRFMAESMPQKIFTASASGDMEFFNQQWIEFTGLTFDQIRDWGWTQFIHVDDLEDNIRRWKHSIDTGDSFEIEHRFRRHDGEYRWHLTRAHAMRDANGKISMWIGSNADIHDMVLAQEELMEAQLQLANRAVHLEALVSERTKELTLAHEQLLSDADDRKRLEAEIASTIEGERERLGQELHDGLVQELTGVDMLLHVLAQKLQKVVPEHATEASRLCQLLEKAHGNARDLAKSFYPVELEQHGLVAALEEIAQRMSHQFGLSCVVQADGEPQGKMSDITLVQFFRIAQEAIQNAGKHAGGKHVLIRLSMKKSLWELTVQDDGVGLPDPLPKGGGMGLRIMQYRARIIQGTLTVKNALGGGVVVSCSAPTTDGSDSTEKGH
jgi:PAS domain S-box-containing protein